MTVKSSKEFSGVPSRVAAKTRVALVPSLDALVFSGAGLAALLIGSWVPDPRLDVSGVPIGTVLLASLAFLATAGSIKIGTVKNAALIQIPIILLGATIFWSPEPGYGLDKFTTLVVSGNIAFVLLNTVVERYGPDELARILLGYLTVLLTATIVYKLAFGFFDRRVSFLMNGSIVFGRLMSIAAVLAMFVFRGWGKVFFIGLFVLAVVWTESKGPVLAVLVALVSAQIFNFSPKKRYVLVAGIIVFLGVSLYSLIKLGVGFVDIGRLGVLLDLATGNLGLDSMVYGNRTSIGSRWNFWIETVKLIYDKPLGVGLGGWADSFPHFSPIRYPHNLFLELWAEGGIILGSFASVPFLLFLFVRKSIFSFVALALLLAQMVSGDIADARMMFIFSLLACFSRGLSHSQLIKKKVRPERTWPVFNYIKSLPGSN